MTAASSLREPAARTKATPIYSIGAASRLTGIPIWTLRWVERHKLVSPVRTAGNQRLFSDDQIDLLNEIRALMAEEVNLPGIRIILRMRMAGARKGPSAALVSRSGPRRVST